MSLFRTIFGPVYGPRQYGWSWATQTYSGETVSVERSLGLVPIYNAVSQIAGGVATLPLVVYRREGQFRKPAEDDAAWALLNEQPNPEMAADEFWELAASHIELWGNAFIWKVPDPDLQAVAGQLWVIAPRRVKVSRELDGSRGFWIEGNKYTENEILHIRGLSLDGLVGYSPIQLHRNQIGITQAQERFQGSFLKNEGKPAVLLKHPNKLSPEAAERLKSNWESIKSGGTAVLEEGIEPSPWTMPLEDAQFIEQMEFSDKRVAQMFLVPPGRLGTKSGDSLTYKTTESENLQFVTYTLQRRLKRIESALGRDRAIITSPELSCEFLVDGLLRADLKSRYEAYERAVKSGFLTVDDVRAKENLLALDSPNAPELPPPEPEILPSPPTDPSKGEAA
jgi:HK97 family phage portal protein